MDIGIKVNLKAQQYGIFLALHEKGLVKISKVLKMQRLTECSGKEIERGGGAKYNGLSHKLKVILRQTSRQIKLVQLTLKQQKKHSA
jgi:hypothetical protein